MTLPFDPALLGSLLFKLFVMAGFIAAYAISSVRNPMARRLRVLNARREQLKAGITASTKRRTGISNRSRPMTERIRAFLSSLRVLQDSQLKAAHLKMVQAGIRSKDAAVTIIFGRMVTPVVAGLIVTVGVYGLDWFPEWDWFRRYALVAGTLILAYKAPDIWLKNMITKRSHAIRKGLPDALDLLVICAEAGLTVDAAFHRVARELGKAYPELGDEFALTAVELGFLTDRRSAFENLAERVPLDAVKGVTTTMIQTEKYGTPLAAALRILSAEFRNERMMRAEEKAARLPAIMTVPLILFILPTLFIVILGPAACSISDAFSKM